MFSCIIGFQFGSITYIKVSPIAYYRLSKNFVPGVGFTYQYSRFLNYYINTNKEATPWTWKSSIIGGSAFARHSLSDFLNGILCGLFAHVEFNYFSYKRYCRIDPAGKYVDRYCGKRYSDGTEAVGVPGLLIGGGLKQSTVGMPLPIY